MKKFFVAAIAAFAVVTLPAFAADQNPKQKPSAEQTVKAKKSVTHGSVVIDGDRIRYDATAGTLILKNKKDKPVASMSYVAYVKSGVDDESQRPITFLYNGGPGSATIWLHMLAFGPERVVVGSGKLTPPAPYKMVNNGDSLLDASDLVFVDAPGTGFGRVIGKDEGGAGTPKDVYGFDEDAHAFAQFITRYLTQNGRWNSPKYLFGESYGTTRSAILANILETDKHVGLNGVILLSSILNWSIGVDYPEVNPGVNVGYETGLPSYAATAWYHHKLPQQPKDLQAFLKEVEHFAMTDYAQALSQGDRLDAATKRRIAEKLHQYTGLPAAYIIKADLRVSGGQFAHELLGANDAVTGRLDSRYSGPALDPLAESANYDPMDSAIDAPTVSMFNQYVRKTLDFGKGMTYKPGINVFMKWNFKHQPPNAPFPLPFTPNVMPDLASAMKHNPNLKVLLMGGYFDLGTPFYAARYEMHQLGLKPRLQKNISYAFFESGHMVYLNPKAHKGLHDAAAKFINANYKTQ